MVGVVVSNPEMSKAFLVNSFKTVELEKVTNLTNIIEKVLEHCTNANMKALRLLVQDLCREKLERSVSSWHSR